MSARWLILITQLTSAAVAQACSGPGAQAGMAGAEAFALIKFVLVTGMAVGAFVTFRRHSTSRLTPLALAFLALTNPYFTISAYSGDCGIALEAVSTIYMLAGSAFFARQQIMVARAS